MQKSQRSSGSTLSTLDSVLKQCTCDKKLFNIILQLYDDVVVVAVIDENIVVDDDYSDDFSRDGGADDAGYFTDSDDLVLGCLQCRC